MERFPKFIIEGENLIMAKVTYHKNLATDFTAIKGGGFFSYNQETNTFTFSGSSHDFGRASLEDVKKCVENKKVFSDIHLHRNITDKHNWAYNTNTEIIKL